MAHQAPRRDELPKSEDRGDRVAESKASELSALAEEERIGANHESTRAQLGHPCEGGVEVFVGAGFQHMKLQPSAAGRGLWGARLSLGKIWTGRVDEQGE